MRFRVRHQRAGYAGAACFRRHVELVEFIALQHREPQWRALRPDDPHIGKRSGHPFGKTLARPRTRQRWRQDRGMGILPAVVPEACERVGLGGGGRSCCHRRIIHHHGTAKGGTLTLA